MIALLLMGFAVVALWGIPGLVRNRWWKELVVFLVLWSAGIILGILTTIGITLPPLSTLINKTAAGMFGM